MNDLKKCIKLYTGNMDVKSIKDKIEDINYIKKSQQNKLDLSQLEDILLVHWYFWKIEKNLSGYYSLEFLDADFSNMCQKNEKTDGITTLLIRLNSTIIKNLKEVGIKMNGHCNVLRLRISDTCIGRPLTCQIVETFFNINSLHLLFKGNVKKYPLYNRKLKYYKKQLEKHRFSTEDFVIVSSGILGIYGMREPIDIDMVTLEPNYKVVCDKLIDCHHHVLQTYEISAEELVRYPKRYVYWNGIKFAALDIVYKACCNRIEETKKIDGYFIDVIKGKIVPDSYELRQKRIRHYYLRTSREWKKKKYELTVKRKHFIDKIIFILKIPYFVLRKIYRILRKRNENNKG